MSAPIDFVPNGPVLSIFDFDGTLFKSPAPSEALHAKYSKLTQPTFAGGLGWFQSDRTLAPPIVPLTVQPISTSAAIQQLQSPSAAAPAAALAPDAFDRWFIAPTVQRYVEAKARGDVTAILTGRETSFTKRIGSLLEGSGFAFDHLFLKRHPRGGTVAFKVEVFLELLIKYRPSLVVYYEDRAEQGEKLFAGMMRALTEKCSPTVAAYYRGEFDPSAITSPLTSVIVPEPAGTIAGVAAPAAGSPLTPGGRFKMVFIDPSLSDTVLSPSDEAWLSDELVKDAKASGGGGRGRGGYRGGRGGGGGGGYRSGKSDEHRNRY